MISDSKDGGAEQYVKEVDGEQSAKEAQHRD
jgi:hypothetical protein